MTAIARFFNIVVWIYPEMTSRHHQPHVHVRSAGNWCVYEIETGKRLAGKPFSPVTDKKVRRWLKLYQEQILKSWRHAMKTGSPLRVPSLPEHKVERDVRCSSSESYVPYPLIQVIEKLKGNRILLFFSTGKVREIQLPSTYRAANIYRINDGGGLNVGGSDVSAWSLHEMRRGAKTLVKAE